MPFFKRKTKPKPAPKALDLQTVLGEERAPRDSLLTESLQSLCVNEFPDNEHNTWSLLKTLHIGARTFGLIEPEPNDVGYDRFVFVFSFSEYEKEFVTQAIYYDNGGRYYLLATTPDFDESLPGVVDW